MNGTQMRNILFLLLFLIIATTFWRVLGSSEPEDPIALQELVNEINAGNIKEITVDDNVLTVTRRNGRSHVARKGSEQGVVETLRDLGAEPDKLQDVSLPIQRPSQWHLEIIS